MRKILLTAVMLTVAVVAMAIPAKRVWRTVVQPDGSRLKVMLIGDERLHYFVTEDNVPVMEYNDAYYYADGIGFGMKRSDILAHNAAERSNEEMQTARAASVNRIEQLRPYIKQNLFRPTRNILKAQSDYTSDHKSITGEHKSIVILVYFPNKSFASGHDSTYYWNMVNQVGYTNQQGAIGSIHDYFYDQSNGQLDLTFDVVGPIEMDYNYSHYGGSSSDANDENPWEFAYEAINKVHNKYTNIDWSDYDWDGDGEVENLYIIYAGYGQATGGGNNTIWPAQTNFDDYNNYYATYYSYPEYNINFNGVKINTFAYGNEIYGGSRSYGTDRPQGMGTMTHEFSHCLGYPDLYNTDYSGAADMGYWSILASGSYSGPNGIGWVPTGYTAYEKWAAGWIDYNEFKEYNDTIKNLKSTYNGGNTYVIYNDRLRETNNADAREYFLFENRTQNRWDTYIPAQGLEVIHVNYVKSVWDANAVNTPSSSYGGNGQSNLILVPADNSNTGSYYDTGESTDLYPYNRKDSITPDSRPSLTFYNNQNDGQKVFQKKIVQIKWNSSDSTASFIYNPMPSAYTPAPVISGEQYFADSTVVTITADKGNIRYSTDSINWQEYSVPIVLRDSAKIYAYAYRSDGNNSEVTSMEFIKMKKIDAPVISGDSVFTSTTRVTISAPAGRIMYSLQSNGGTTFRNYSHSFTLSKSDVVYAFVTTTAKGYINSDTVSMKFRKEETPTGISGITAPATNFVSVYTIDGQLVATSQRLENIVLRRGTYIVRDQNGRTRKIALK